VDLREELRQVQVQGDETAEGEEVEEHERPCAPARAEDCDGVAHRGVAATGRRVTGKRDPQHEHGGDEPGGDEEGRRDAGPVDDPRGGQAGEHGAAHACAVDPERGPLAVGWIPAVDEWDADRKRGAREPEQEAEHEDRGE
jgi:hypothetical protein